MKHMAAYSDYKATSQQTPFQVDRFFSLHYIGEVKDGKGCGL